jgi:hypothetical protein
MMAGLVDVLWSIEDLWDAVMKQQAEKKHRARVECCSRSCGASSCGDRVRLPEKAPPIQRGFFFGKRLASPEAAC